MGWGGRLFEAGRLLTFSAFRFGAYSRWALIRGSALIRINTVCNFQFCDDNHFISRTSLILPLFFSVAFIQRTNVRGGYGNSWGKFFPFFFLSFNFSDVSRAAWKRYLNCQSTWWSLQGGFNFFFSMWTKSCGWCYHPNETSAVVLSHGNIIFQHLNFFHKVKYRNFFWWISFFGPFGQKYVDKIMQCDRSNKTSLAAFSRGTFYFSAFYKVKFWNFLEFFYFVLLWQCKVDNQVQSFTS